MYDNCNDQISKNTHNTNNSANRNTDNSQMGWRSVACRCFVVFCYHRVSPLMISLHYCVKANENCSLSHLVSQFSGPYNKKWNMCLATLLFHRLCSVSETNKSFSLFPSRQLVYYNSECNDNISHNNSRNTLLQCDGSCVVFRASENFVLNACC